MPRKRTLPVARLEDALLAVRTREEAQVFLEALLTPYEQASCRNRWSAFQLILAGATQRSVRDQLKVSIATASRSARVIHEEPEQAELVRELLRRCGGQ